MLYTVALAALLVVAHGLPAPKDGPAPPTFADAYNATGFILLPYAHLKEPFEAYYDKNLKKSRIDYYNGTMRTFQIATTYNNAPKAGAQFKIVWSPNVVTHDPQQICYQANGTDAAQVNIQSVLPDLSSLKYIGSQNCSKGSASPKDVISGMCDVWQNVTTVLGRNSTYTFFAQKSGKNYIPVRYSMMGFDSLFGSHYDQYELIYSTYKAGSSNGAVFDVVKIAGKCVPYPAGSGLTINHLFNPMKEFVHHDETHLHEHFDDFKATHDKKYEHELEEAKRKDNFRNHMRYINSMNRQKLTYTLKMNHMGDFHQEEFLSIRGKTYTPGYNGGKAFPSHEHTDKYLPDFKNWTAEGAVGPVKDQAICGSCWSFGTSGHIEGQYYLKTGKMVRFSEQQLVDCSWNFGNGACDGGEDFQAYRYIVKHGLSTDEQYGDYLGIDGKCHDKTSKITLKGLNGWFNVTGTEHLKMAVAFVGPISVGIDAAHTSFSFYSSGVFTEPKCGNRPQDLDHSVLAVGYGSVNGTNYFIVKNSWSTHWGDQGYVLMNAKDNMCGIATAATYVDLKL